MEILATNTSYDGYIVYNAILFIVFIIASYWLITADSRIEAILYIVIILTCLTGAVLAYFYDKGDTTHDAIVTDWNEVHEQGYEVVETNGKIVTLRKVDE